MTLETLFRPKQFEIMGYQRGKVGVAAVPGSGKTFTLAHLAANLVRRLSERKDADQSEVLIVTFTNVAMNSFKRRLSDILRQRRFMLPYVGYRVCTLHALASDILHERPALAGLADDFGIVDDRAAASLRNESVQMWLRDHGTQLIRAYVDDSASSSTKVNEEEIPKLAFSIAERFIRHAKDNEFDPATLREHLQIDGDDLPLARFGVEVYESYQQRLSYMGAVDFDDLARLALHAIRTDSSFRKRLQQRWPYILEDEAQDSSKLQQEMLRLLSDGKNWIRVGDPNQAINTTFTTANPNFLRDFLEDTGVKVLPLDEAGRSARPILDLANYFVHWTAESHPAAELRAALALQEIKPTLPGDPQPNPPTENARIRIEYKPGKFTSSEKELEYIVDSLARWLPEHPDETVAVLVPENDRGFRLVEMLRERGMAYEELLRSTTSTRAAAKLLYSVLGYLAAPVSSKYISLADLYRDVWWPLHLGRLSEMETLLKRATDALGNYTESEAFLWPDAAQEAPNLNALLGEDKDQLAADLETFRQHVRRWLEATILPIDQLVLTINQDLFADPADIALGYKFAALLRGASYRNPGWRLPEFVAELRAISLNERKFLGFESNETGYEPTKGRVTVSTIHQAKGLEWDRVYLSGVSNYVFPSLQADDTYLSEKWFVRDGLNLEAEALAQLHALIAHERYTEGTATAQARIDHAAERLRLLYVGITRARRELCITWNTGRFAFKGDKFVNQPALPLIALWQYQTQQTQQTQQVQSQSEVPTP